MEAEQREFLDAIVAVMREELTDYPELAARVGHALRTLETRRA